MRVTHKNNDQTRFLSLSNTHARTQTQSEMVMQTKTNAKLIKHDQQFVSM